MSNATKPCASCGQPLDAGRKLSLCPACLTKGWQQARTDSPSPAVAFEIPGHEILSELARGGMGIVYRARQKQPQREVAIKMLMPQIALEDLRERFRIEAKVMAGLVHPGIMPIYQYGEHTGVPWISMALCGRGSLAALKEEYRGQWRRIAELMKALSEAVAFAHAHGVLHRDLKPGNVLFDDEGRAFLSDFGLAKVISEHSDLTRTISLVGTPHYLAPELISNADQATTASDVYALGAILYELLAGRPPFDGQNVAAILKQISEDEPAPLPAGVPQDLATIALKCLSKAPAQRNASAQDLADDLRRWLRHEPITARRLSTSERLLHWCRRKPAIAILLALLILCVVAASWLLIRANRQLRDSLSSSQHLRREALMGEARAVRQALAVQSRDRALEAVAQAARIQEDETLREEAAALLALPSVAEQRSSPRPPHLWGWLPDERMRVAADFMDTQAVRILELPSGRELARLPPGQGPQLNSHKCFDPEGKLIVYTQTSPQRLVVMDWRTGQVLLSLPPAQHRTPLLGPGPCLLTVTGKIVNHYDLKEPVASPQLWPMDSQISSPGLLGFSPDGRWFAISDHGSGRLSICDALTGAQRNPITGPTTKSAWSIDWLERLDALAVGYQQGSVMVYISRKDNFGKRTLPDHSDTVRAINWHPRGDLIVTSSEDDRTRLVHAATGEILATMTSSGVLTRFFDGGQQLLVDDMDQGRLLWHEVHLSPTCLEFAKPEIFSNFSRAVAGVSALFTADDRLLVLRDQLDTNVYDLATGRRLLKLTGDKALLQWDPERKRLWSGSEVSARSWEIIQSAKNQLSMRLCETVDVQSMIGAPPTNNWLSVARALHAPSGNWVLAHGEKVEIRHPVRGLVKHHSLAPDEVTGKTPLMSHLQFSEDGRWMTVASNNTGLLLVLDTQTWEMAASLKDASPMRGLFSDDSQSLWVICRHKLKRLTTGAWKEVATLPAESDLSVWPGTPDVSPGDHLLALINDRDIDLRDGRTGALILRLKHPLAIPLSSVSFSADGGRLACTCTGQLGFVWDLHALASEFGRLGLHWPGPKMVPLRAASVTSVKILPP